MSALTASRNTKQLGVVKAVLDDLDLPQAATKIIFEGALVVVNASGYCEPATQATAKIAAGVAALNPNTGSSNSTGFSNGDLRVRVRQGVFRFNNSAAGVDLIAQADVGKYCWMVDDQTVAKSSASSARSKAGVIIDVDSAGVWVAVGLQLNPDMTGAAT
jgi:hypothetical protein